ncbi:hypothetical protein Zmor_023997 [Zophobas morio]|uniref:Uncharacterized protein n=1 Tax=Zophobas morio TaxID=2755281 RepID=A0AA38HXU2_9CUCU|nr:hypothetical protein Zmor_023997 [Zophobas morio]
MGFSCRKRDPVGFCTRDNETGRSLFFGHLAQPPVVQEDGRPNAMRNYLRRFYTCSWPWPALFFPPAVPSTCLEPSPSGVSSSCPQALSRHLNSSND